MKQDHLIVGGYGIFGGRIVELLENEPRLTLMVAGRSPSKAEDYCRSRMARRRELRPAVFDRDGDLATQLAALTPELVVDASGPFQAYGEGRYRLIEACIASRINYLDLADGSEFVAGVAAFDAAARQAGVFVLSGVSSFPVLTAAVVRRLASDMSAGRDDPGRHRAFAVRRRRRKRHPRHRQLCRPAGAAATRRGEATGHPFTEQMRYTIAPGGKVPVKNTLFSLVDVPDLRALAELWPEAKIDLDGRRAGAGDSAPRADRAGLAGALEDRAVAVAVGAADAFVMNRLRWGEHRGGMFVEVEGAGEDGKPLKAILASARRRQRRTADPGHGGRGARAQGRSTDNGRRRAPARRCAISNWKTTKNCSPGGRSMPASATTAGKTGSRSTQTLLGDAWQRLPEPIRAMHSLAEEMTAKGRASVERGTGLLVAYWRRDHRLSQGSADTPVQRAFRGRDGVETWTRTFGTTPLLQPPIRGSRAL